MALSMATVCNKLAQRISEITGVQRVHSWGLAEADEATYPGVTRIPEAMSGEFPAIIVSPDTGIEYQLGQGMNTHKYTVSVEIYEGNGDIGLRAATAAPFLDLLILKLSANVLLGGTVDHCKFTGWHSTSFSYAESTYTGFAITVEIREEATVTPAGGT